MSNMEWCVENKEYRLLNLVIEDEDGIEVEEKSRVIIFTSEKDAKDFVEEFNFDLSDGGAIVERIIFAPKIDSETARQIMKKRGKEDVKSTN